MRKSVLKSVDVDIREREREMRRVLPLMLVGEDAVTVQLVRELGIRVVASDSSGSEEMVTLTRRAGRSGGWSPVEESTALHVAGRTVMTTALNLGVCCREKRKNVPLRTQS